MKRSLSLLLVLALLAATLWGCGEKATGPEPGTPVSTFFQAVLAAQPQDLEELIFFEESGPELIQSFYPGLEKVALNQQAFYMPPIATYPCEIVLAEVADSTDVQTVVEIFQARIDLGADDTTYPESAAGWQQYAQVQSSGNFVCMIVLPGGYYIPEDVFTLSATVPATTPATEPATEPAAEPSITLPQENAAFTQQITNYYTAISGKWDENACLEKDLSALTASYYECQPLENLGYAFMDLDGDDVSELVIGAIQNAAEDPLVLEIWTLKNGEPLRLVQSGSHNRYYLQYAEEDELWSVAYEAEDGAATHAVYYLQLVEGEFLVSQGIVYDAKTSETEPWFMAYDLDWDVTNDSPIDEETAVAILDAGRNTYTSATYTAFSQ